MLTGAFKAYSATATTRGGTTAELSQQSNAAGWEMPRPVRIKAPPATPAAQRQPLCAPTQPAHPRIPDSAPALLPFHCRAATALLSHGWQSRCFPQRLAGVPLPLSRHSRPSPSAAGGPHVRRLMLRHSPWRLTVLPHSSAAGGAALAQANAEVVLVKKGSAGAHRLAPHLRPAGSGKKAAGGSGLVGLHCIRRECSAPCTPPVQAIAATGKPASA